MVVSAVSHLYRPHNELRLIFYLNVVFTSVLHVKHLESARCCLFVSSFSLSSDDHAVRRFYFLLLHFILFPVLTSCLSFCSNQNMLEDYARAGNVEEPVTVDEPPDRSC